VKIHELKRKERKKKKGGMIEFKRVEEKILLRDRNRVGDSRETQWNATSNTKG